MEMPALLASGGCTVDVFCTEDSWVLQNKFYDKSIVAAQDATLFSDKLLAYVSANGDAYDWIIPADDIIIRILNEKITSEKMFYKIMPLSKIENRAVLGSKAGFSNLCQKYNIATPRYLVYNNDVSASDIVEKVGFPLMMKMDKSEGGFGIYICRNVDELLENFAKITDTENLVFQQFIEGYEVNTELLAKNGELIQYNYSKRLKTIGRFGVSTQRTYCLNNDLDQELQYICKALGISGFGNVVFMYSVPEQRYYLIEVDARPNSWMYYGQYTGNDFAIGIKKLIAGDLTFTPPVGKDRQERFVALYKKDVYRCLVEKDAKELAKWAFNVDGRWKYVPTYDKMTLRSVNKFLIGTFKVFLKQKISRDIMPAIKKLIPVFKSAQKSQDERAIGYILPGVKAHVNVH